MADQQNRNIDVDNPNVTKIENGGISASRNAAAPILQKFSSHNKLNSLDPLTNRLSSLKKQWKSQKGQSPISPDAKSNPNDVSSHGKNRISSSSRHVIATTKQKLKSSLESKRKNTQKITDVSDKIIKAKNTLSSKTLARAAKLRESLSSNEQSPKCKIGDVKNNDDTKIIKDTFTPSKGELSKIQRPVRIIENTASKLKREGKKQNLRGKHLTNSEGNRDSSNLDHVKNHSPLLSRNGNVFDRLYNLSKKSKNVDKIKKSEKERDILMKNVSKQKKTMEKKENETLSSRTKKDFIRKNKLDFSTPTSSNKSTPVFERSNGIAKNRNSVNKGSGHSASNRHTPSFLKARLGYIPESCKPLSSKTKSPVLRAKSVYSRLYAYGEDMSRRRSEELLQGVKLKSGEKKKMSPARRINFNLSLSAEKVKDHKVWKKGLSQFKPERDFLKVNNGDSFDSFNDTICTTEISELETLESTVILTREPTCNDSVPRSKENEISVNKDLETYFKETLISSDSTLGYQLEFIEKQTSKEKILQNIASHKIQRAWRTNQLRNYLKPLKNESLPHSRLNEQLFGEHNRIIMKENVIIQIQSFWRRKRARNNFIKLRNSAIDLQSWLRSVTLSRSYKHKLNCVTKIQIYARKYISALKVRAAITIQNLYRNYMASIQFKKYKTKLKVKNVLMIQSKFRMYITKKKISRLRKSALMIEKTNMSKESVYSQANTHKKTIKRSFAYKSIDTAVGPLHKKVKMTENCNIAKGNQITNIVLIQCAWRQYKSKLQNDKQKQLLSTQYRSACIIQSLTRKWMTQTRVKKKHNYSLVCQRLWRGYKARLRYQFLKDIERIKQQVAAKKIQINYRKWKHKSKQINASVAIQRIWRGYKAKLDFEFLYVATILIQRAFRNHQVVKTARILEIKAVYKIQSVVRRWLVLTNIRLNNESAIMIQKIWLGYKSKLDFKLSVGAAFIIQRCYRCRKKMKDFSKVKQSALAIQSTYRGYVARKQKNFVTKNLVKVQSCWRGYLAHQKYHVKAQSVIILQSWTRTEIAKSKFTAQRSASLCLQKNWRRKLVMRQYSCIYQKVILIQSIMRKISAQNIVKSRVYSIIILQARIRCHQSSSIFKKKRMAIILIQILTRGFLARKRYHAELNRVHAIKSTSGLTAKKYTQDVTHETNKVVEVECRYEGSQSSSIGLDLFTSNKQYFSSIDEDTIQNGDTLVLVSNLKMSGMNAIDCNESKDSVMNTLFSLGSYDGSFSNDTSSEYLTSSISFFSQVSFPPENIQTWNLRTFVQFFHGSNAIRALIQEIKMLETVKTKISHRRRMFMVRIKSNHIHFTVKKRSQFNYSSENLSFEVGIILQGQSKNLCFVDSKNAQKYAYFMLQTILREIIPQRIKKLYKLSCTKIQRLWRSKKKSFIHSRLEENSVVNIQRVWRGFYIRFYSNKMLITTMCTKHYGWAIERIKQQVAAKKIQINYRKWKHKSKQTNASVAIQRIRRGYKAKLDFEFIHIAAILIQRAFRNHQVVKTARILEIKAVYKIQSVVRRWLVLTNIRLNNESAIMIQKIWLGYKSKLDFKLSVGAAFIIQRCYRCRKKMKDFSKVKQSALAIQSTYRGYVARKDVALNQIAMEEAKILTEAESAAVKQVRALSDELTFPLFKGIDHSSLEVSDVEPLAGESSSSSRQLSLVVVPTNNAIFHTQKTKPLPQYIRTKHQSSNVPKDEIHEISCSTLNVKENMKNVNLTPCCSSLVDSNQTSTIVENQKPPAPNTHEESISANEKKSNFAAYLKEVIDTNSCTDLSSHDESLSNHNIPVGENGDFDWINNW